MAKVDPRDRIRREQLEIASAEGLFQDDPRATSKPAAEPSSGSASGSGEIFALADGPSSVDLAPPAPVAPPRAPPPRGKRGLLVGQTPQSADQTMLEPSALVEEVWSRSAEWGPTFLVVAAWGIFIFLLVYFGFGTEYLWTALLTLLLEGWWQ